MTPSATIEDVPSTQMEDGHTCLLINEMQKAMVNEEHPPKTLRELDLKITECKGTKKPYSGKYALTLSSNFVWSAIQRKWISLVDTYKHKKDNIKTTGAAYVKFRYFYKLDALLGDHHGITKTVIVGPSGVVYQQTMEPAALQNEKN